VVLDVAARQLVIDLAVLDRPPPDLGPRRRSAHRVERLERGVLALLAEGRHRHRCRPARGVTFAREA
jgi:hypothetical protein